MIKIEVKFIKSKGTWREVADSCNTTIGKEEGTKNPSSKWITRIIRSEHSPIRQITFKWQWINIPYFVSVHFTRHFIGIIHWVKSQRTDRLKNKDERRDNKPQNTPILHEVEANIQSLINISRKRLCHCALKETREAWKMFLDSIKNKYPEVYNACVKECVYRNGFCSEFYNCGYNHTQSFLDELQKYQHGFEEQINKNTLLTGYFDEEKYYEYNSFS